MTMPAFTLSFSKAFTDLMGNEGGYSNHPKDPGQETMWGITKRVARAHGYLGSMRDLPRALAMQIAYTSYWTPLRLDEFTEKIAFQIFDANYNGGHPVIWMQASAGAAIDGILGPETIAKVRAANSYIFTMKFLAYRLTYFTCLKTWPTFGKGWARRIANNLMLGSQ